MTTVSPRRFTLDTRGVLAFVRHYAVVLIIIALMIYMTFSSDAFLTPRNLLNILNQSAPLAIIAAALTLVIIGGGFDLSTGAIFGVATVSAAWIAVNFDPVAALVVAPLVGLVLGVVNGIIITSLHVHSFLATLATSLVFRGIAILITGGFLIQARIPEFQWLGRERIAGTVNVAVIVLIIFVAMTMFLLNRTTFGRRVYAVGGNEEAAILSGVRVGLVKIGCFALTGVASGLAAAIAVSRLGMGQPQAGMGMELEAIAAVILGGTSIYGGEGAVWRSVAGVSAPSAHQQRLQHPEREPLLQGPHHRPHHRCRGRSCGCRQVAALDLSSSRNHRWQRTQKNRFRVSADIGGTFTDLVFQNAASGETFTGKILSTPANPAGAVIEGLNVFLPEGAGGRFPRARHHRRAELGAGAEGRARRAGDDAEFWRRLCHPGQRPPRHLFDPLPQAEGPDRTPRRVHGYRAPSRRWIGGDADRAFRPRSADRCGQGRPLRRGRGLPPPRLPQSRSTSLPSANIWRRRFRTSRSRSLTTCRRNGASSPAPRRR